MVGQVQRCLSSPVKGSSESHTVQIQSGPVRRTGWWDSGWWCKNNLHIFHSLSVSLFYLALCALCSSCSHKKSIIEVYYIISILTPLRHAHITKVYPSVPSLNVRLYLVTIATDRVAKVPASESGGGCQGDGAAPVPCILHSGKRSLLMSSWYFVRFLGIFKWTSLEFYHFRIPAGATLLQR